MWFLFILSIFSTLVQICLVTLAIAAGLYYLADLVEENTAATCRIIRYLIWVNFPLQIGLWLCESFPATILFFNVVHQFSNLAILKTFPHIALTSPSFIFSLATLVYNHYLAFSFFSGRYYPFTEVLAYFTFCLWMIPMAFFVSLSANEYTLPQTATREPLLMNEDDLVSHYFSKSKKKYGLLQFFTYVKETVFVSQRKQF